MMQAFFTSGHAVDVVLAVLAVEAILLRRQRWPWTAIFGALMPAVLMMLALRAALIGMAWPWVAVPLTLAFPVHLYDVRMRGRSEQ
jgi:hypothetical protein